MARLCDTSNKASRFKPSWTANVCRVADAAGQALAYINARDTKADADTAKVLTMDEARRVASNIAKLPILLSAKRALQYRRCSSGGEQYRQAANAVRRRRQNNCVCVG